LLIRGILIALSGFLFIFAPGVPMGLLRRYGRGFPREFLYWGMGICVVASFLAALIQSLIRQSIQGIGSTAVAGAGEPSTIVLSLVAPALLAVLLAGGMAIYSRRKTLAEEELTEAGLTLGFGAGLIVQVFRGLDFVGAGLRLAYEGAGDPGLAHLANLPLVDLLVGLLAEILFRIAVMTVCGVVGILVVRSLSGSGRLFWLGAATFAAFSWPIVVAQLAMGSGAGAVPLESSSLLASASTAVYHLLVIALAYHWLQRQLARDAAADSGRVRRARGART
jgi:hypothetical protein